MKRPRVFAAIGMALALCASTAKAANWTVTLDVPDQVAGAGATVVYTGVITNDTGGPLALDAGLDFFTSPSAGQFTVDFAPELLALDLVIPPGGYSGPILEVGWTNAAPGGSFGSGSLTLASAAPADPVVLATPFTLGMPGLGPFCGSTTGLTGAANAVASDDSLARPVFVYHDAGDGTLHYAARGAAGWNTTLIAAGVGGAAAPSLVMDGDLHPHVAFYDAVNGDLVHAWDPGSGWQMEAVDTTGDVGVQPSLTFDALGALHVSYRDATRGDLRYAVRGGGLWTLSVVDTAGDVGAWSSIATDAQGQPFISYHDATAVALKLARRSGAGWTTEVVDAPGGTGTSIRAAGGTLAIAYRKATPAGGELEFASGVPGSWSIVQVDASPGTGAGASLVLNGFAQPRIAYFDAASSEVRLAARTGSGTWTVEPVATGGTGFIGLALGANEEPLLSYGDAATAQVWLASNPPCATVSVGDPPGPGIAELVLNASRPNPFTSSTTLSYTLARRAEVRIRVFDPMGRIVAEPFRGVVPPGTHEVSWKGTTRSGARLPAGRYLYEVRTGGERRVGRLVLLR